MSTRIYHLFASLSLSIDLHILIIIIITAYIDHKLQLPDTCNTVR